MNMENMKDMKEVLGSNEGADASAVAQGQLGDLAFLAEMAVDAVLLHRDMEHF